MGNLSVIKKIQFLCLWNFCISTDNNSDQTAIDMNIQKALKGLLLLILLPIALHSCSSFGSSGDEVRILTGAKIYDGTGNAIEHGVVLVRNGRIECVGGEGECPNPPGAKVMDVTGKFLMPGLVDAHVHFFQTAFFDSRPDAMDVRDTYPYVEVMAYQKNHPERYYRSYLCSGITGVYDVGGFPWSIDLQHDAENNETAPHVSSAGPLLTPSTLDLLNTPADKTLVTLDTEETARKTVRYLTSLGSTGIKLWQLKADDPSFMRRVGAMADEIEQLGNHMIVHATTLKQAKAALEYGPDLLVHSVSDREVDRAFLETAKEAGTIYTPTLIVGSGYMRTYRAAAGIKPFTLDDPNRCVDEKTRTRLTEASRFKDHPRFTDSFVGRLQSFDPEKDEVGEAAMNNLKKVYEAGIPIAVGTDAGNPGTLHGPSIYREMEAMQRAGISPEDLIVMATQNGARAMHRSEDIGTLEQGKIANLIVLEEDPSVDIANIRTITHTMIKGRLLPVD